MATFEATCNECGNVVEIDEMVYDIYMEEEEKESVIEETLSDLRGVTGMEFANAITLLSKNYYQLTQQEIELIISLAKRL